MLSYSRMAQSDMQFSGPVYRESHHTTHAAGCEHGRLVLRQDVECHNIDNG